MGNRPSRRRTVLAARVVETIGFATGALAYALPFQGSGRALYPGFYFVFVAAAALLPLFWALLATWPTAVGLAFVAALTGLFHRRREGWRKAIGPVCALIAVAALAWAYLNDATGVWLPPFFVAAGSFAVAAVAAGVRVALTVGVGDVSPATVPVEAAESAQQRLVRRSRNA